MNIKSVQNKLRTWIWALKLIFLCIGFISTLLLLKLSLPNLSSFLQTSIPGLWLCFRACLSPPYLYIIVNCIIITIAASSSFQKNRSESKEVAEEMVSDQHKPSDTEYKEEPEVINNGDVPLSYKEEPEPVTLGIGFDQKVSENEEPELIGNGHSLRNFIEEPDLDFNGEYLLNYNEEPDTTTHGDNAPIPESSILAENNWKLSLSGRFLYGKTVKMEPPRSFGVTKPKPKYETLESTWRAIMERKSKPLNRHLKKSDTWDTGPRLQRAEQGLVPEPELELEPEPRQASRRQIKKSETFVKREKSMSQEELNRRAEAFIKKVNDDIRLQRQESYQHYVEMVNRGSR
ncbi:uncharacterized protein LOC18437526 [Amborella trichopoda]|uniref:DUF4408 domain-containing protein n=1 Tax=Amborella trichopoda TaxID=13333 RepID=W1PHB3_AMBTC|nr:uncharacterized protein LOC18437526 [Amborella trichopoda]ERN09382.1 hypothetical protein AMTR_s00029p00032490 [Amborella trichopoda]|eukprot:XP_006847801.1 uncharacterized protein LOC18437526 [Amborella trichopoda]